MWRERSRKMRVLHAFPEKDERDQEGHLEFWFGYTHPEDRLDGDGVDMPVVCYCGGRLEPFAHDRDGGVSVAVVWHLEEYRSRRVGYFDE